MDGDDNEEWTAVGPRRGPPPPQYGPPPPRYGAIDVEGLFRHFIREQDQGSTGDFVSVHVLPTLAPRPGRPPPPPLEPITYESAAAALQDLRANGRGAREFALAGQAARRLGISCGVRVPVPGADKEVVTWCAVPGDGDDGARNDAVFFNMRAADSRRPGALFDSGLPRLRPPPPHITVLCAKPDSGLPNTLMTHVTFAYRDNVTQWIVVKHDGHDRLRDRAGVAPGTMEAVRVLSAAKRLGKDPGLPSRAAAVSQHLRRMETDARAWEPEDQAGGGNFKSRDAPREGGLIDTAFEAFCIGAPESVHARLFAPEDDGTELLVLDSVDPNFPYAVYVTPDDRFLGDSYLVHDVRVGGEGGAVEAGLKAVFGFLDGCLDLSLEAPRPGDLYPRLGRYRGGGAGPQGSGRLSLLVAGSARR